MAEKPEVDQMVQRTGLPKPLVLVLAHLDPIALGAALGTVTGAWIFLMTATLVLRRGEYAGRNLSLLSQYFIGYSVTARGCFIGFFYGALVGFIIGHAFALLRNLFVRSYVRYIRRRAELEILNDLLDRMT